MFMWTNVVNSLPQAADHPMSCPRRVDRAGPVLEESYHAFERRCACFSYDISS